jgi:hypothetical protein
MEHYICKGGCQGVSKVPGTCQASTCPSHQMPLEACDCDTPEHAGQPVEDEKA